MHLIASALSETARIRTAGSYYFRVWIGKKFTVMYHNRQVLVQKGDVVGIRKAATGEVRIVVPKNGPDYLGTVYTLSEEATSHFAQSVRFMTLKEIDAYGEALAGGRFA